MKSYQIIWINSKGVKPVCAATEISVAYLDVSKIGLPVQPTGLVLPCGTSRRRELDED